MEGLNNISALELDISLDYKRGTVVETTIIGIVKPSQVITYFPDGFMGRLSLLDISWCFPEAQDKFRNYNVGEVIKCVVNDIDIDYKQIKLSQKHLEKPLSDTIKWERIERGDEFNAKISEQLNDTYLIKTNKGLYGLLHKSFLDITSENIKVKVNSKLDNSDLLSFVPADLEVETVVENSENLFNNFSFIEDELQSFSKFKRSVIGSNATDKECLIIQDGFNIDDKIFSKEFATKHTLYIQFEFKSSIYETTFKQQAIPYFIEDAKYSIEFEKKLLELFSKENYWFKVNKRKNNKKEAPNDNEDIIEFSLYNERINFFGEVQITKDKKEYRFIIRNFSFGNIQAFASEAKKRNTKYGSFLFSNQLKVLSPLETLPLGNFQKEILESALLKTNCFEIINRLKLESGEILKQEGRTLAIIDKFLEYQISLIDDQKENNVFVDKFEKIPSPSGGVSIKLPISIANSLEIEEETVVNIRLMKDDDILKLTDGNLSYYEDACKITFYKEINLDLLKNGFYIDKRISKRQFQIQREIIQDFLEKKIKIDHIESLLVNPDKIKTPVLSNLKFNSLDLVRTELEQPDNNQVIAVKKAVGNNNIFLIQGPPGTGKTTVIAEIIEQLVAKGQKILVSGQNHVSVDNVLEKMAKRPGISLLRVGNPDRVDKDLVKYCIDNLIDDYKADYSTFINNQLLLSKEYLRLKQLNLNTDILFEQFNNKVNEISVAYDKLYEVYKHRHFILRDGLNELNDEEIEYAITSLNNWILSNNNDYEILLKPLIYNTVEVVFATCIGIKSDRVFSDTDFKFDTVIIDEAGKANIAETLVAIELGKKVILVGDQMQLPPYMDSSLIDESDPKSFPKSQYGYEFTKEEIQHALKTSFFEFIINRIETSQFPSSNKVMLNYQHRMHPNIGQFVSESFYDGLVQMGNRTHLNRIDLPTPFNKEVVFFDTSNSNNPFEQNDGYSAKNDTEAEVISEIILPRLFENNISPRNIAIIAPYKSQVANILRFIKKSTLCNFKNIDVSTLDSFQGKEYDIILFSFTRSSNHKKAPEINGRKKYTKVGFLDDARRLNVAFSRAKKKLIFVGNSVTLTDTRSHYDGLFNYTQLFKRLVELSHKEEIGNFINIADLHDFKTPFDQFVKKHKVGDILVGQINKIAKASDNIIGLFVIIDNVQCLLPLHNMPESLKDTLDTIEQKVDITVVIDKIDQKRKYVYLKLDIWNSNISKVEVGNKVSAKIIKKVDYGYFVELGCSIQTLLHKKQIQNEEKFELNQVIDVEIINIDFEKQRLLIRY